MIDEKELINEIKRLINSDELKGCTPNAVLCEIYDRIMEQSKTGGWIPFAVNEKGTLGDNLPKVNEKILVSDGCDMWVDTFIGDKCGRFLFSNVWVGSCAWMPLPEPYKEGKENGRD